MILFKKVRYKNFLSTGDKFTEINLNESKTTLVVGHNGAGKSTMLDAVSFALFGRGHRNISKAQLLNSINKKGCIVEVEFLIGKAEFKIIRGIKPNIFEIWKNNKMINQSSHAKEYQKILEQNILKLNHKSFHQVVVLGSSSFIPFMQLNTNHRRDVIEDLLDINVFSKMNTLLREQTSQLKEEIRQASHEIEIIKSKTEAQEKYIKDVTAITNQTINKKRETIKSNNENVKTLQSENNDLSTKVEADQGQAEQDLNKYSDKKQSLLQYQAQFKQQMGQVVKDAKFYEGNEICPTCSQDISQELRQSKIKASKVKAKELTSAMDRATEESTAVEQAVQRAADRISEIREWQSNIHANNKEIERLQNEIQSLEEDIHGSATADLKSAKADLKSLIEIKENILERKLTLSDQFSYNNAIAEMLRDSGIKTKIIKQYLPVINQLVNQYLGVLDFFVHFDLDENFSETIRSRHRDDFSYDSFSEGEKQRIDLSLLFTWRQVAKKKNSVATNLLILDETFDSSLDHDGVENLLKILYTLGDETNVFVISHKGDILDGKFDNKIEFVKEKNFSKMVA